MQKFVYNLTLMLTVTFALLLAVPSFAMSFGHAAKVFAKVAAANHIKYNITLVEDHTSEINASMAGGILTLNTGLLKFVGNDDNQIALVLGHEIAHLTLHHSRSTVGNEYAADKLGAVYMQNAGYNKCEGANFFRRLETGNGQDHPYSWQRVAALGCGSLDSTPEAHGTI